MKILYNFVIFLSILLTDIREPTVLTDFATVAGVSLLPQPNPHSWKLNLILSNS